jgi:hypothetical protein
MVNGRLFDAATLNELGNHPRQRAKLFFEVEGNEAWGPSTSMSVHHDAD